MIITIEVRDEVGGEIAAQDTAYSFNDAEAALARLERFIQARDKALFVKSPNTF